MSKKIKIDIPNKVKPNLISLFHEYLSRKAKEPIHSSYEDWDDYDDMAAYWDRVFPGWDDDIDDESDVVFPLKNNDVLILNPKGKGKGKKKDPFQDFWSQEEREESFYKGGKGKMKHKKGKKAKMIDINAPYSGYEDEYNLDDIGLACSSNEDDTEYKEIWFYPDYHCKDDKLEFNSIKEFNDYCESQGYFVSREVANDLAWRYESHCCLCPESEKIGLLEIMAEHSYGEMFFEACDEQELGDM
jgi:hypothetical protein